MTHEIAEVLLNENIQQGDLYYSTGLEEFFIITSVYQSAAGLYYFRAFSQKAMKEYPISGSELARYIAAGMWIRQ